MVFQSRLIHSNLWDTNLRGYCVSAKPWIKMSTKRYEILYMHTLTLSSTAFEKNLKETTTCYAEENKWFQFSICFFCISDLSPLSNLPYLLVLDVSHNKLTTVLDFEPPKNLREVDLSYNEIEVIADLSRHHSLTRLNLDSILCYKHFLPPTPNGRSYDWSGGEILCLKHVLQL